MLTPDTAHALAAIDALEVGTVKVNAVFGGAPAGRPTRAATAAAGPGYGPDLLREMVVLKAVHWEPAPSPSRRTPDGGRRAPSVRMGVARGYGMGLTSARPEEER